MGDDLITLAAGDYEMVVEPGRGGSIARLTWRGKPILRHSRPGTVLHVGYFPLVPFCNRIAAGRFRLGGQDWQLAPNMPEVFHPHPLHGSGWVSKWDVAEAGEARARIVHHAGLAGWPCPYEAEQRFTVAEDGVTLTLSATNLGAQPMPCGLGFHPYFERDEDAVYHGLHHGEWRSSAEGLPEGLRREDRPVDWWGGQPISARDIDTVYEGRSGPIAIQWPSRGLAVGVTPSANLPFTAVFSPPGGDFFCIEPMSHMTDAINRDPASMTMLAPGETMTVSMTIRASC